MWIRRLLLEREINYELFDETGFVCRLVPGFNGFELSKLDQNIGQPVPRTIISFISEQILNEDA